MSISSSGVFSFTPPWEAQQFLKKPMEDVARTMTHETEGNSSKWKCLNDNIGQLKTMMTISKFGDKK